MSLGGRNAWNNKLASLVSCALVVRSVNSGRIELIKSISDVISELIGIDIYFLALELWPVDLHKKQVILSSVKNTLNLV